MRSTLVLLGGLAVLFAWTCGPGETSEGGRATRPPRRTRETVPVASRLDPLEVERALTRVSSTRTYDSDPALAVDSDGSAWAVWVAHEADGEDRVLAAREDGGGWSEPEQVTPEPGLYVRPTLTAVGEDLVALWTATGDETGIWMSRRGRDGWSRPERASPPGHHLNPEACDDGAGGLWMVWQGLEGAGYDLFAARLTGAGWSEPLRVTSHPGNDWDPAVACDSNGALSIVWSSFRDADYDLWMVTLRDGELGEEERITGSEAYDMHPSAAIDGDDRLWIAWDRMELVDHNRSGTPVVEEGRVLNEGVRFSSKTEVRVQCLDEGRWFETEIPRPGFPLPYRFLNSAYPKVAVDASGAVWAVARVWCSKLDAPRSYWWDVVAMRCSAKGWRRPAILAGTDGNADEPAVAVAGNSLWVAAAMDHRVTPLDGNPHPEDGATSYEFDHYWNLAPSGESGEVVVTRLGAAEGGAPALVDARPPVDGPSELATRWVERAAAQHEIDVDGEHYRLLFGDTHRHSNISRCSAGSDSTLADHHRYSQDVARLDFMVMSDHSNMVNDFNWWSTQKAAELYYLPGRFTMLFGYEISAGYPFGHRNVIFPERPPGILRLGMDDVETPTGLWKCLEGTRAMTIPHTPAAQSGNDWGDNDPRFERLVEVFQARTGSYEHAGAPRLFAGATNEKGFVHRSLEKGYRLGFIASTDHGFGASYAAVYARGNTREDVFEALYARRCYGSTAYGIVLDVRANGHLMGSELEADEGVEVTVDARAYADIERVDLFAGTRIARSWGPDELRGKRASLAWKEPAPPHGSARSYYVRVALVDAELAWSSPIWVTYP